MVSGIGNAPALSIHIRSATSSTPLASTAVVLDEIGKDPSALDTQSMHKLKLESSFQDFDITSITPAQLGLVSKNLYALGLIDVTTANLMVNAGNDLDKYGNHTSPDVPMNALDYFASRITNLQSASTKGNLYASFVIPDYTNTVHVLQDLDSFAKLAQQSVSR